MAYEAEQEEQRKQAEARKLEALIEGDAGDELEGLGEDTEEGEKSGERHEL